MSAKRLTVPDSPEAAQGVSLAEMIAKAVQAAVAGQPAYVPPSPKAVAAALDGQTAPAAPVAAAPTAASAPAAVPVIAVTTAPRAPKTETARKEKLYKVCNLSDGRTVDAVLYTDPARKVCGCIGLRGLRGASEWSDLVLSAPTWKLLFAVAPHVSPIIDKLASEAESLRNGKK